MPGMKNSWETEFQALSGRERAAFRWLGETLYRMSVDPRTAIISEMEEALIVWQAAAKALGDFALDFRAQQMKLRLD